MTRLLDPQCDGDVSLAWLRAFDAVQTAKGREILGLVVEVRSDDGVLRESQSIREALDSSLVEVAQERRGRAARPTCVQTVASTIFPRSMWNPDRPRGALYARYNALLPKLVDADQRNRAGTYFSRFLEHDQLEHVIATRLDKKNRRRSAYQLAAFDPSRDHSHLPQKGFPCLHQVSLLPDERKGTVAVVAYYPTQTLYEKAYGNYVGLWDLGAFVATAWGLRMESLTCFAAVAKAVGDTKHHQAAATSLHLQLKDLL